MERSAAAVTVPTTRERAVAALSRPHNWVQLAKFCVVGASGYVVNLAVYTALLRGAGHPLPAGRRLLVPRRGDEQLHVEPASGRSATSAATSRYQGLRFLVVSSLALGANLLILDALVGLGSREDRGAGGGDHAGDAAELRRQQALVVQEALDPARLT